MRCRGAAVDHTDTPMVDILHMLPWSTRGKMEDETKVEGGAHWTNVLFVFKVYIFINYILINYISLFINYIYNVFLFDWSGNW